MSTTTTAHESLSELTGLPREIFANEIFKRYGSRLLLAAESHLSRQLRAKVGPEDVVQSTFKSFFRRLNQFNFADDSPDAIWALLVIITIRKCRKWETFFNSCKRDVHREVHDRNHALMEPDELSNGELPEDVVVIADLIERLLSHFDARRRSMILLRIEGHEIDEIALRCVSSRRTVARTIAESKLLLARILHDQSDEP